MSIFKDFRRKVEHWLLSDTLGSHNFTNSNQPSNEFVENSNERLRNKILYIFDILETQTVINSKIIKKLTNTNLYELRIQTENEYRILTFSIDHENINQATTILLISGFMKKATKDYDKEIKKAIKILEKWTDQN